jgi:ABC-type phosphate transport system permease subunit
MIKKLTSYLDYSMFAELALVLFAIIFIVVVIRTLMTRSDETRRQANIVLGDKWEQKS